MKITVFRDYREDYPEDQIICLNDFNKGELKSFCKTLHNVIAGVNVNVHEEDYISESECKLTLKLSEDKSGLKEIEYGNYICFLDESGYRKMIDLIEAFFENDCGDNHFQWLYDIMNPIDLLLSNKCRW